MQRFSVMRSFREHFVVPFEVDYSQLYLASLSVEVQLCNFQRGGLEDFTVNVYFL